MDIDWGNLSMLTDAEFFVLYGKYMAFYDGLSDDGKNSENKLGHMYMMKSEHDKRSIGSSLEQPSSASSPDVKPSPKESPHSTLRLVLAILAIAIAAFTLYQARLLMLVEAWAGEGSGSVTGLFVALLMITSGIVSIVLKNKKTGVVCCTILFGLAALMGIFLYDDFGDLQVWGVYCAIVCVINALSIRKM